MVLTLFSSVGWVYSLLAILIILSLAYLQMSHGHSASEAGVSLVDL